MLARRLFGLFLFLGVSVWLSASCSPPKVCTGVLSETSLNPNGSTCKAGCECNNLRYTGMCVGQGGTGNVCVSIARSSCESKGEIDTCVHHLLQCEGTRVCAPELLGGAMFWGDCACKGVETPPSEPTAKEAGSGEKPEVVEEPLGVEPVDMDGGEPVPDVSDVSDVSDVPDVPDAQRTEIGESSSENSGEAGKEKVSLDGGPSEVPEVGRESEPKPEVVVEQECNTGDERGCYTGPAGTKGVGSCQEGVQECDAQGRWGSCQGQTTPGDERCNGMDDDCDGDIDEGIAAAARPACEKQQGVCKGSKKPAARCKNGIWEACKDADYSAHSTHYRAGSDVNCDYRDNDCDGAVDEDQTVTVEHYAGSGSGGSADGPATVAQFLNPEGLIVHPNGDVYVADRNNHKIRKLQVVQNATCGTQTGYSGVCVTTYAGTGTAGTKDGPRLQALLDYPVNLAFDSQNNLYFLDGNNHALRKIDLQGRLITVAGAKPGGSADGKVTTARFQYPTGIAIDAADNIYIADAGNHRIRKVDLLGNVSTLAGSGSMGFKDGQGRLASFNEPTGVAVDKVGNITIADSLNNAIRKLDVTGKVTTLAGSGVLGFRDGDAKTAQFYEPRNVAVHPSGTVYVADQYNHRIRQISPDGKVSTYAGKGINGFANGPAAQAEFNRPFDVALHPTQANVLFVVERAGRKVRKITCK